MQIARHAAAATAFLALLPAAAAAEASAAAPSYQVESRIAGPDGGWDYASFDPAHRRVYVARAHGVMAIDVDSGQAAAQFAAGTKLHSALALPGGDELLLTDGGANTASIVDANTGAVRATIPTGKKPDAAMVDPATGLAFVMNADSGDITVIDLKAGKSVGLVPVGGALEFAVADGEGRLFVNVEDKGEIAVVDTRALKVVARYPLPGCEEPSGLAYAPRQGVLISACANSLAEAVSARTGALIAKLVIGPKPDAAFYDDSRGLAFIPSGGDGSLSEIAVRSSTDVEVVGRFETQKGARTGAIDTRTGRIYLPTARFAPPATAGAKPTAVPGSFEVLVVGAR